MVEWGSTVKFQKSKLSFRLFVTFSERHAVWLCFQCFEICWSCMSLIVEHNGAEFHRLFKKQYTSWKQTVIPNWWADRKIWIIASLTFLSISTVNLKLRSYSTQSLISHHALQLFRGNVLSKGNYAADRGRKGETMKSLKSRLDVINSQLLIEPTVKYI